MGRRSSLPYVEGELSEDPVEKRDAWRAKVIREREETWLLARNLLADGKTRAPYRPYDIMALADWLLDDSVWDKTDDDDENDGDSDDEDGPSD